MPALENARLLEKLVQPGRCTGRGVERRLKVRPLRGVEAEASAVGQRFLSAGQRAFKHELTQ